MKRAAEKQLVKDQVDNGDDDIEEVSSSGFRKADESVLAGRQIRALPRRSLLAAQAGAAASSAPPTSGSISESTPPSRFAGFSGFGASANSSAPSSFSGSSQPPGAPKLAPTAPVPAPFSFTASSQSQSLSGLTVSSTASPATKAFASIVSSSSTPSETASATAASEDWSEIEYYKALRGLNVSFLSAVSKAIESDPFVDVAELLERYKSLRVSVKADFDDKSKGTSSTPGGSTSFASSASKAPDAPQPPVSFAMPAAPTSFAGFNPPAHSSPSPSSTPASGGFVPNLDSGSANPFSFAVPRSAELPTSEAPKSAFSFGSSSTTSNSSAPTSAFTFAPAPSSGSSLFSKPSSTTSLFGSTAAAPSAPIFGTSSTTASSIFGGSTFGAAKDSDKEKEKEADKASVSIFGSGASSPFGPSTNTGSGATTPDQDKSASSTPFSFGSASPGKPSFFGSSAGFGAAKAGSIGNPVGFGFGSPPKTPETEIGNGSGPVKSLPFSFAPLKPAEKKADGEGEKKDGSSTEGTPAPDASANGSRNDQPVPLLAASSAHDAEGDGEEDEVTVHEIRSKVYKMTKDKEGKSQWGDMGVGMLRLKKHKETGVRRVLLRNSSTGKITINFLIHSGMNATIADKAVSFMGHEEGASVPYRIRMKTNEQAKELKTALDREIEFVKSKSDS